MGTWNVGGKAPGCSLNLEDFLQIEGSADMYILGYASFAAFDGNSCRILLLHSNNTESKLIF